MSTTASVIDRLGGPSASAAVTADPPAAGRRHIAGMRRVLFEVSLIGGLFFLYEHIRFLTRDQAGRAFGNADRVVDVERAVGVFREGDVQAIALHSDRLIGALNRYYVGAHFPVTALFVLWVLVRHASSYRAIRTWLIAVTAAGLAIHVLFPLAPPRMLADEGLVDTLREFGPNIYQADTTQSVANQFAAMPSLHFGWALLVALGIISILRSRFRWLALAHPATTLVAIVATANHYFLDAAVAGVLVLVAGHALGMLRRTPPPGTESRGARPPARAGRRPSMAAAVPTGHGASAPQLALSRPRCTRSRPLHPTAVDDASGLQLTDSRPPSTRPTMAPTGAVRPSGPAVTDSA